MNNEKSNINNQSSLPVVNPTKIPARPHRKVGAPLSSNISHHNNDSSTIPTTKNGISKNIKINQLNFNN
jgi:hypothetical protein